MAEMRGMFDYVLIDAPPVNLSNEAALLGQQADGVVLVIEANCTHREAARKAKERLEAAKSPVLAAVLNNRRFPIPEGIYRRL
jgi:Mrp family chromosome partitioning ATPase